MTKKRFIKLVMSYGIQRNEAEAMAFDVEVYGGYENLYKSIKYNLVWRGIKLTERRIAKNIERGIKAGIEEKNTRVCKAMKKLVESTVKATMNMKEFREAVKGLNGTAF